MRSKLFVPGSRPEFFAKALASDADAISVDLEDSVVEDRKAAARDAVREWLRSADVAASGKIIIVRVNAIGTAHFEHDVAAVAGPGVTMLNLPKPESAADVQLAAASMARAESANGVAVPIRILANIETPIAFRLAREIAGAHARVAGLQLGLGDLFEPLGIARHDARNVHAAMWTVRMAAGEAGVFAYDGAFADVQDETGFREEAAMASRLGFLGKSCIHPRQIALANEAFLPRDEEIVHARKVIEAARLSAAAGVGAVLVDGKMIDAPFVRRAEMIVAMARNLELIKKPGQ